MAEVSIVIPTYNEVENIRNLIVKLVALNRDFGKIVVDDNSSDGTAVTVEELSQKWGNIVLHRRQGKLGIGSAIREGMEIALSFLECHYIVTMDADLSHNPEDLPALLAAAKEGNADLIQGSRYIKGGGVVGWNFRRKLQSRVANLIGKLLFNLPNEVTTSFRVYTRESAKVIVDKVSANKYEFAVASALAIKDHGLKIKEVPIVFVNRTQGKSKLRTSDVMVWLAVILRIFVSRQLSKIDLRRFFKFCLVGGSGILVNMGFLWILTEFFGLFYVLSAAVSIEASILTNFILNDFWTFRYRRYLVSNITKRALKYNLTCGVGVAFNLGILTLLTEVFGVHYLVSNFFGIVAATVWNYGGSTKWAWKISDSYKG
ncbi:GtrA family protein [Chloroflexota bacterium]